MNFSPFNFSDKPALIEKCVCDGMHYLKDTQAMAILCCILFFIYLMMVDRYEKKYLDVMRFIILILMCCTAANMFMRY